MVVKFLLVDLLAFEANNEQSFAKSVLFLCGLHQLKVPNNTGLFFPIKLLQLEDTLVKHNFAVWFLEAFFP